MNLENNPAKRWELYQINHPEKKLWRFLNRSNPVENVLAQELTIFSPQDGVSLNLHVRDFQLEYQSARSRDVAEIDTRLSFITDDRIRFKLRRQLLKTSIKAPLDNLSLAVFASAKGHEFLDSATSAVEYRVLHTAFNSHILPAGVNVSTDENGDPNFQILDQSGNLVYWKPYWNEELQRKVAARYLDSRVEIVNKKLLYIPSKIDSEHKADNWLYQKYAEIACVLKERENTLGNLPELTQEEITLLIKDCLQKSFDMFISVEQTHGDLN